MKAPRGLAKIFSPYRRCEGCWRVSRKCDMYRARGYGWFCSQEEWEKFRLSMLF